MWLCTKHGFFSVVCARESALPSAKLDPARFMVRARKRDHILALIDFAPILKGCEVLETRDTDYPIRIFVPKAVWSSVMVSLASDTDYGNFKNEAARTSDREYSSFLSKTWRNGCVMEGRR